MENLIQEYQKSLKIIEKKIKKLKKQLKNEKSVKRQYMLKQNIVEYERIRGDLLFSLNKMKRYL